MRAFVSAFNFSRRVPLTKFVKPSEIIKAPKQEDVTNKKEQDVMEEINKMTNEFEGTKTMRLVDSVINGYLRKGYRMDQIIGLISKGNIINDEIKKAFQNDAKRNDTLVQKQHVMEQQMKNLQTENPELFNQLMGENNMPNKNKGTTPQQSMPKYSHEKQGKDKQQKQESGKVSENKKGSSQRK